MLLDGVPRLGHVFRAVPFSDFDAVRVRVRWERRRGPDAHGRRPARGAEGAVSEAATPRRRRSPSYGRTGRAHDRTGGGRSGRGGRMTQTVGVVNGRLSAL